MQTSGIPNSSSSTVGGEFSNYTVMYESESGYSVLYRAQKGGKWFALKGIKKSIGEQAKFESILRREFDLHKKVTSIYCAECYELIQDPNVGLCIVMQYVNGITLNKWLAKKPSGEEKSRVLSELLKAIGELHLNQIIHQDIKPENIIITNNGSHVKLIDFGLSDNDAYIAQARGCTNKYASPELKAGGQVSFASDIWALGCIINDIFPHKYCFVKAKCHHTDPNKRYASVNALSRALGRADAERTICWLLLLITIVAVVFVIFYRKPQPATELSVPVNETVTEHETTPPIEIVSELEITPTNETVLDQNIVIKPKKEVVKSQNSIVENDKEIAYLKLVQQAHIKYDSCYKSCVAVLDTCPWSELCMQYRVEFSMSTDSIRKALQPADSIEKMLFNDDYMECHKQCYYEMEDMVTDKTSLFSLSEEEAAPLWDRYGKMALKITNKH